MISRPTETEIQRRRRELVARTEADLIVLANPRHVFYYSGFRASELSLSSWTPAYVLIDSKARSTLLIADFSAYNAAHAAVDELRVWRYYDAATAPAVPVWRTGAREAAKLVAERSSRAAKTPKKVGIEAGVLPGEVVPDGTETVDLTEIILDHRRSKSAEEVSIIEDVVAVTGAAHERAREVIRPGVREVDVHAELLRTVTREAGEAVNLVCDILSGPRAYKVGGLPSERVIQSGEPVIVDLNPFVGGYRADYTATLVLAEELPPVYARLEDALHRALEAGEAALRPGTPAREVHEAVRASLERDGFSGSQFPHHAGHGIGLGHPEAPFFVPESTETVVEGDVVTLEPGAYGEDFGARIEHNYVVEATGPRRLSAHDTSFRHAV